MTYNINTAKTPSCQPFQLRGYVDHVKQAAMRVRKAAQHKLNVSTRAGLHREKQGYSDAFSRDKIQKQIDLMSRGGKVLQ